MNLPAPKPTRSPFRAAGTLAIFASFVIVVAGMKAAATIVVPFLLAVFIAVILTPLFIGLQKRGMRPAFALIVIILLLLAGSGFLFLLLSNSLTAFNKKMPEYQRKLTEQQETVIGWLKENGIDFNVDLDRKRGDDPRADDPPPPVEPIEPVEPDPADVVADQTEGLPEELDGALAMAEGDGPTDAEPDPPQSAEDVVRTALDPNIALKYLGTFARASMGLLSQGFLILIVVIFILFEAMVLPAKVRALPGMNDEQWARMRAIVDNIRRYMALKTVISLLTGVLVAIMLYACGIPFALLLGLLAFVLNFVPNVGSAIAAIPAVLLALVDASAGMAVGIGIGYILINVGVGNGIEPRMMGKGLGLSPLIILLSLIFWGWVLGPVGMLLSVPLTMTGKIILEADPSTQWIALLMGGSPGKSAAEVASQ